LGFTSDTTEKYHTKEKLQNNKDQLQFLFDNMNGAFAYHKIVLDENGKPVDYIFVEVNKSFEYMVGLKKEDIIGKKVTEALPGTEKDPADWIGKYGEVALTGKSFKFEKYSRQIGKWFYTSAYSPMKGYFATIFDDITIRKENEEKLQTYSEDLEVLVQARTIELENMNTELRHYNKLFVGREFRIKELRDKIKSMDEKLKKYES
jgi:PAS domain S-box-containing protein